MFPDSACDRRRSVTGQTDSSTSPDDANFVNPVKRKSASGRLKGRVYNHFSNV